MKKLVLFAVAITFTTAAFANGMESLRSKSELTSFDAQMMNSSEIEMPADPYASRYQGDLRNIDARRKINTGTFRSISRYESKEAAERTREEIVKNLRDASAFVQSTDISAVDNGCNHIVTVDFATTDNIHLVHGAFSTLLEMQVKIEDLELSGMKIIFVEYKSTNIMGKNTYQILYLSPAPKRGDSSKLHYGTFNSINEYESEEKAQEAMNEIVKNLKDNSALIWRTDMSTDNGANFLLTVEFGSKNEIHTLKGSDSPVNIFLKIENLKEKGMKIIATEINQSNFASNTTYQILYLAPGNNYNLRWQVKK